MGRDGSVLRRQQRLADPAMHDTALAIGRKFFELYSNRAGIDIIEVGSQERQRDVARCDTSRRLLPGDRYVARDERRHRLSWERHPVARWGRRSDGRHIGLRT